MSALAIGLLAALVGAGVGAFLGHYFTMRQFNERSKKQKEALYNEVLIFKEDYINCFKDLIDDFETPLKAKYLGLPHVSTRIIDNLMIELSSSNELLSKDQRALLVKLEVMHLHLDNTQKEKNIHIHAYLQGENQSPILIRYHAAEQLFHIVELIFYLSKMLDERENFIFSDHEKIDMIQSTCRVSNINFDEFFWKKVKRVLSHLT